MDGIERAQPGWQQEPSGRQQPFIEPNQLKTTKDQQPTLDCFGAKRQQSPTHLCPSQSAGST